MARYKGELWLVRDALRPREPGIYGDAFEAHTRPAALAEIKRRGIDIEAVRRKIRAIVAELRKLPDDDLMFVSIGNDAPGLWVIAGDMASGRDLEWLK